MADAAAVSNGSAAAAPTDAPSDGVLSELIAMFREQNGTEPTDEHLRQWAKTLKEVVGDSVAPAALADPVEAAAGPGPAKARSKADGAILEKSVSHSQDASTHNRPKKTKLQANHSNHQSAVRKKARRSTSKTGVASGSRHRVSKKSIGPAAAVVGELRQISTTGASKAIFQTMQQHMIELDQLVKSISKVDIQKNIHGCHDDPFKFVEATASSAPIGQKLFRAVQEKILQLEEMTIDIKLWIRLHLPKRRAGGQAYFISKKNLHGMIVTLRSTGLNVLQTITQHAITRGRAVAAVNKAKLHNQEALEDSYRKLVDVDSINYHNLLTSVTGVRDAYCLLVDRVNKDFGPLNMGI